LVHFLKWQVGLAAAQTQTTFAERDCLARQAQGKRCLVEIGVWHGVSTCRLRTAMADSGVLYAVDPYPVGRLGVSFPRRIARAEVRRVSNGRVEWIRLTGVEAARTLAANLAGKVDFVFIDGDHSYDGLRGDWEGWAPLLAPGGVVALHDSRSTSARPIDDAGSVRYTQEVIRADQRFAVTDEIDSLTVLRRLPPDA
jgi:predicted O-methyltransferase YrrM